VDHGSSTSEAVTTARLLEPVTAEPSVPAQAESSPVVPLVAGPSARESPLGPAGVLIDLATATASLPVVGRFLRPLGAATAMGVWGYRHLPGLAVASARAATPRAVVSRSRAVRSAAGVYERALIDTLVAARTCRDIAQPARPGALGPLTAAALHRRYVARVGVPYGPDPAHRLDVWRRRDLPLDAAAPVLVYFPAGGWVYGSRRLQAHRMLAHLAEQGWVCLSADYRVAPHHPWPAHIHDVKRAIAWARTPAGEHGGGPGFVAVAGCSAGGHLATLAGLTANDPDYQPDLPGADTSVDAVVSIYGRYDWEDREGEERASFMAFLERVVVQRRQSCAPDVYRAASPLARVHPDAPPFLLIHGAKDTIIPVAQAREFVAKLREVSRAAVAYAELPGAQHAFDLIDNQRTASTADAVARFLHAVRSGQDRPGRPGPAGRRTA
jgi:acetyl esterase/lipase